MEKSDMNSPSSSIIYIGSIPFEWDKENLEAVVCGVGNVLDVRLGFDHIGKNKGFAFVEFESPEQAAHALQLLSKIQIVMPGSGQVRRFRTGLSKEPFKSSTNESRTFVPLKPDRVPNGVQFPPEVVVKYPQLSWASQAKHTSYGSGDVATSVSQGGPHNPSLPGNVVLSGTPVPHNASNTLPEEYLNATRFLALPKDLPFAVPDKINETLSQIPPPQLIELIANLKNILNSPDSARASEVFRLSPHLAASATQALLLMGFIDDEVIQEAMQAEVANPNIQSAPLPPENGYPNSFSQSNMIHSDNNQNVGSYAQSYGQPGRNLNNQSNAFSQGYNSGQGYAPKHNQNYGQSGSGNQYTQRYGTSQTQNQNSPSLPPPPAIPATSTMWPHLPLSVQMKLANVPKDQAELIVQVLSLTPEQVNALPLDRQNMVAGIRQQYS